MALKETLSGALSGLAKSIGNVGKGVYGAIGNGVAAVGDLGESIFTGKATTRRQDDFIKDLYKTDDVEDAMLKQAGTSLDAASTLADFLPGTSNPVVNSIQGGLSAFGDEYATYGKNADLGQALKNAGVGAASSAIGGKIGGAIAGKAGGKIGEFANSTLGRGAITGAASGATAGGLSSALNGGSLTDVLGNTVAGAGSGAVSGAATAGAYGVGNKVANKVGNKIRSNWNTQTPVADVETTAPKRTVAPIEDETFEIIDITDNNGPVPVRRRINVQGANESDGAVGINRPRTANDITEAELNKLIESAQKQIDEIGNVSLFAKDADSIAKREKLAELRDAMKAYEHGFSNATDYKDSLLAKSANKTPRKAPTAAYKPKMGETTLDAPVEDGYTRLYRGLDKNEFDPSFVPQVSDNGFGYESWTDNYNLANQYGGNVYAIDVPSNLIKENYISDDGDRAAIYRTDKSAGLNGVNGTEFLLNVNDPMRESLTYSKVVSGRGAPTQPATTSPEQPQPNNVMAGADDWYAPQKTRSNLLSRTLKNAGNDMMSAQTNVTRAERKAIGVEDAGQVINNVRRRTGISDMVDQAEFAKRITGKGGDSIMDTIQTVRMAHNPKKLTVDDYAKVVDEVLDNKWEKTSMGDETQRDKFRNSLLDDLRKKDPIQSTNWLKDKAETERAIGSGNSEASTNAKAKAAFYTELAEKMDDLSYSAIPKEEVARMFDDTIEAFKAGAESYKNTDPQTSRAFEMLANELEKTPKTIRNYRSFKKDFVKSSEVAKKSLGARSGSMQTAVNHKNIGSKIVNSALETPVNRLLAKAGGAAYDLGTKLENTNIKSPKEAITSAIKATNNLDPATMQRALNMASRQASRENLYGQEPSQEDIVNAQLFGNDGQAGDATAGLGGQSQVTLPAGIRSSGDAATDAIIATAYDGTYSKNPAQLVRNAMELALAAGDIDTYNSFAETYKDALELYPEEEEQTAQSNGLDNLSDKQIENINKIESAEASIDQLEELFNKAGGAKGVIGGRIANMTASAGMNSDVATYNQIAKGLINQIAAATGKTDTLNTEGEVKRALDLIPAFTDTKETAQAKLTALRQMLATNKQNMYSNYGVEQ